jgi:hypothetical protein
MYSNLAPDEVALTFFYFFYIPHWRRTDGGQTFRYIEAAHCLKMPKMTLKKMCKKMTINWTKIMIREKTPEATNCSYLTQQYKQPQNQCLYCDWFWFFVIFLLKKNSDKLFSSTYRILLTDDKITKNILKTHKNCEFSRFFGIDYWN